MSIRFQRRYWVAGLVLMLGTACLVWADANSDALKKAPAAVQATVKKLVGDNKMGEFAAETANGKTVYDLEFSINGTNYAADIDPSGAIIQREVNVDIAVIPPEIIDAVKKSQPKGIIAESAIGMTSGKIFYLIETKVGNDLHELKINAEGKVTDDSIAAS